MAVSITEETAAAVSTTEAVSTMVETTAADSTTEETTEEASTMAEELQVRIYIQNHTPIPLKKPLFLCPATCQIVFGPSQGLFCSIPFIYKGRKYNGCTMADASDGKPWCSALIDRNGVHVGGQGKWGHCPSNCQNDFSKH